MKTDWQIKKLSEIGTIFNGNSINENVKKKKYSDLLEGLPFIATKDIDLDLHTIDYDNGIKIPINEKGFKVAHKNSALICAEGGSAGKKIAFSKQDICFGNKLFAIEVNKSCDPKYVYYYYLTDHFNKTFRNQLNGLIGGVSISNFKDIEIPIPPISIQKAIVRKLDDIFVKIEKSKKNVEKNLNNSKKLFESYIEKTFSENKGAEIKSLGSVATFRNGMNFTKGSKGELIKIVGVKDFQKSFWVPFEKLESVEIDGRLSETDLLKNGDILAVRSNGNPQLIGRTLLAEGVKGKVSHSGFTIRIRLNSKDLEPTYLCHYLKSQKVRSELTQSGTGVNIKSLNQGALSSLMIPVPKSLVEQKSIIKKLDQLSEQTKKLESIYQNKLSAIGELKKSILSKAFSKGL